MNNTYFENIERHCQITKDKKSTNIRPTRRIISRLEGQEIEKTDVSQIPRDTIEKMVNGATEKYKKMTEKIIHQIQTSKRKGLIKYQTLGWKQAKEIRLWCDENNINCDIIEDLHITRNKLNSIDIWYDVDKTLYWDGTRDYGRQYLDYRKLEQKVVYVQIVK